MDPSTIEASYEILFMWFKLHEENGNYVPEIIKYSLANISKELEKVKEVNHEFAKYA